MPSDADLEALLTDLESDRSERKASISERDKIRQAICAFANDLPNHGKPGVVFIGANDNGTCANLPITDELLRTLADMRSDGNILPPPTMTVQKRTLLGCEWIVPGAGRASRACAARPRMPGGSLAVRSSPHPAGSSAARNGGATYNPSSTVMVGSRGQVCCTERTYSIGLAGSPVAGPIGLVGLSRGCPRG